ncbi:alpha/beta fold hydrolase [Psychrobacter sp. I-STPA6b]|uniref:alpha/beta fold hydrolase n=1 Tax=Psychrobacter sp. I-STPA6b TaxID=2585718 RepID=UPI001D0C0A57|nr:alpha/beta fold hydrolase [Psychrobacter sp. I-STPA6b]
MTTTILSADQKHTLHHTFFIPQSDIKATLLIAHGMTEHSGRYIEFAQFLANHGIMVATYDHLGHGKTAENMDELGYFAPSYPMQALLKDTVIMADAIKAHYPDVPHFIMGHSMGSFIVRNVLQHHASEFAGAILMGTSDFDPLIPVFLPMTKMLNKIAPKQRNIVFANTMNRVLNFKLGKSRADSEFAWVCANSEGRQAYEADPLCGFDFTNNGFMALMQLMHRGLHKQWAQTIDKDFAMLFVSGEDDPIGNMGDGVRQLSERLLQQGFTHIDYYLYPNMRHEPLHEVEHQLVYQDILNWLSKTIKHSSR